MTAEVEDIVSRFHFSCHFLSSAGRSSLRGIEEVVARRVKVLNARGDRNWLGRAQFRARAVSGVNLIRESVCMMNISSCQDAERRNREVSL